MWFILVIDKKIQIKLILKNYTKLSNVYENSALIQSALEFC